MNALGYYPNHTAFDLLLIVKTYANVTIMVGLVFSLITLLFASISTLLIYSLLMITTETKRYENGLMRVVGLSKWGYSGMIIL